MCNQTHTSTHTHIYTHAHTHMHGCMHAHIHTHTHTHEHTHTSVGTISAGSESFTVPMSALSLDMSTDVVKFEILTLRQS